MCRKPVGLGAMRTRTGTPLGYWRCCSAPIAREGSRRRSTTRSRWAPTPCSFSSRARAPGGFRTTTPPTSRHSGQAGGAGIPAFVHALYLVNLAAPDDEIYKKSIDTMRATVDAACAIERRRASSSTSAPTSAPGFETGLERVVPALEQVLDRCNERTWLLSRTPPAPAGRSAAPSTSSRDLRRAGEPRAARHLPRLLPPLRLGRRRHRPQVVSTRCCRTWTHGSASTACAHCTRTTRKRRSDRTATATTTSATA